MSTNRLVRFVSLKSKSRLNLPCAPTYRNPPLRYACTRTRRPPFAKNKTQFSGLPLRYIWYMLSGGAGVGMGILANSLLVARFDPPAPGSPADDEALAQLGQAWDTLEVVKTMRSKGYNLHSDTALDNSGTGKAGWVELDISKNIAENTVAVNSQTRTLSQETLAGVRGLGIQRAFWNTETRELVAVVWIGPMLSGWPGVAHGGAISTIFEDAMSRMIAGPNVSIDSIPTPLSMSIDYLRPTMSVNTFVLRASFSSPDLPQEAPPPTPQPKAWLPSWKDFTKTSPPGESGRTIQIHATLEDLSGKIKVRAKGSWPASAIKA